MIDTGSGGTEVKTSSQWKEYMQMAVNVNNYLYLDLTGYPSVSLTLTRGVSWGDTEGARCAIGLGAEKFSQKE